MTTIDHETTSELLNEYASAALSAEQAERVRDHLSSCERCREELVGLTAVTSPQVTPLSDSERARLHAAVAGGLPDTTARRRAPAWPRLARALGAAAAVVAIVTGVGYLAGQEGSSDAGGAASGEAELDASRGEAQSGRATTTTAGGPEPRSEQADEAGTEALTEEAAGFEGRLPVFESDARLSEQRLRNLGRRGAVFEQYAETYEVGDVARLRPRFVRVLARRSAEPRQVETCAAAALDRMAPALPAYGATGTIDGDEVLTLGFAWSDRDEGALYRYAFWAWPRGSCDDGRRVEDGVIERR